MATLASSDLVTVSQLRRDLSLGLPAEFTFKPSNDGWTVSVLVDDRYEFHLSATNNSIGAREFKTLDAAVRQVQSICGLPNPPSLSFSSPSKRVSNSN